MVYGEGYVEQWEEKWDREKGNWNRKVGKWDCEKDIWDR